MATTSSLTEVTAQRKEGRLTTGTTNYNITLNSTPTAGDLILISTSTSGVLVTQNAPTYGGTTASVASSGDLNGSLVMKVWYVVATAGNISAGGTTVNVTCTGGTPTAIGYAVTVFRNFNTVTPIGVTSNYHSSVTNGNGAYAFAGASGNNTVTVTQGSGYAYFVTLGGAYTGYAFVMVTPTTTIPISSGWGPASGLISDIQAYSGVFTSESLTETTTSSGGPVMLENVAASRTFVSIWLSINPGKYSPTGQTIAGTELVADSVAPVTVQSQTGPSLLITELIADSVAPATSNSQTTSPVNILAADVNNGETVTTQLVANTIALQGETSASANSTASITASTSIVKDITNNQVSNSSTTTSNAIQITESSSGSSTTSSISQSPDLNISSSTISSQVSSKASVQSNISINGNVYNSRVQQTIFKTIIIPAIGIMTSFKYRAKAIYIVVNSSVTYSKTRIRQILISVQSNITTGRRITKKIILSIKDIFSHKQQLLTDNWSLPDELEPEDFSIADESEEFVPPTNTTFDYAQDELLDPPDVGISTES